MEVAMTLTYLINMYLYEHMGSTEVVHIHDIHSHLHIYEKSSNKCLAKLGKQIYTIFKSWDVHLAKLIPMRF